MPWTRDTLICRSRPATRVLAPVSMQRADGGDAVAQRRPVPGHALHLACGRHRLHRGQQLAEIVAFADQRGLHSSPSASVRVSR